jgi:hypothetical protein
LLIEVMSGFWFSAHENWGWMQLPYTDVPLMKWISFLRHLGDDADAVGSAIYQNMERARTCNSHAESNPGMYASINNSTDSTGQIIGCEYFSMNLIR